MSTQFFQQHLSELRAVTENALQTAIATVDWPAPLKEAVTYSLMAGGKRLRPVLVLLASDACGGDQNTALSAACAVEMIHTYSLIHDDLPAMDNDDFRRGIPTCHRKFGDAAAILAGDALLTLAFETISGSSAAAEIRCEQTRILAVAAGGSGMVGGQILDIEAERGLSAVTSEWSRGPEAGESSGNPAFWSNLTGPESVNHLTRIHRLKTGALITAALELGAVSAGASHEARKALHNYGNRIGLAFQISDDLLDVTGDQRKIGKETGRDAQLGKLTFPSLVGIEASGLKARELVSDACDSLRQFGEKASQLRSLAEFIVERDH
ncbi:MAG: polyprenyl synthetase family protein [Planctomyces sp.]|jgi:geranylgeranyl diphosphate synthase type II